MAILWVIDGDRLTADSAEVPRSADQKRPSVPARHRWGVTNL